MSKSNYVYILIRKDLENSQRVVQSSHVVWEIAKEYTLQDHPSMVVLGVKNESSLIKERIRLEDLGLKVFSFNEPLFDNKLSSIAVLTTNELERSLFKKYNLLSNESFYTPEEQERIKIRECTHKKIKLDYIETFAYEFTPVKLCKKCNKLVSREVSELEKISLIKEFYKNTFEEDVSEQEILNKKNGFNI